MQYLDSDHPDGDEWRDWKIRIRKFLQKARDGESKFRPDNETMGTWLAAFHNVQCLTCCS